MADIETLPASTRYFTEVSAPSTPSSGEGVLYAATDGTLHYLNDAATDLEIGSGGGGGGDVATDDIWDAAGDLAVGTGANTAAKVTLGNAGGTLARINGAVAWNSGTSFPTAAAGDLFHRTDLSPALWRYDGTRWRSATRYRTEVPITAARSADGTVGYLPLWNSEFGCYLVDFRGLLHVSTTNNGSNYWTCRLLQWSDGSPVTSTNTSANSANTDAIKDVAIGAVTTQNALYIDALKTGSPGNLYPLMGVTYELIAT